LNIVTIKFYPKSNYTDELYKNRHQYNKIYYIVKNIKVVKSIDIVKSIVYSITKMAIQRNGDIESLMV